MSSSQTKELYDKVGPNAPAKFWPQFVPLQENYPCTKPCLMYNHVSHYHLRPGTRMDAPRGEKESMDQVSFLLFHLKAARKAGVPVVFERLVDVDLQELLESDTPLSPRERRVLEAEATKTYRVWFLFTEATAGMMGDIMSSMLAPTISQPKNQTRANKTWAEPLGEQAVGPGKVASEDDWYRIMMQYNMGMVQIPRPGSVVYSMGPSTEPVPAAADNIFGASEDAEEPGSQSTDLADGAQLFESNHVLSSLALPFVLGSYQHSKTVRNFNVSDEQSDIASYWDGTMFSLGSTGQAMQRGLFNVLDNRGDNAWWFTSDVCLPHEKPTLDTLISEIRKDHERLGFETPDLSNMTYERLEALYKPGDDGEAAELFSHGMFRPISVSDDMKNSTCASTPHGESLLSRTFWHVGAWRDRIIALRTIAARINRPDLWLGPAMRAIRELSRDPPKSDMFGRPASYAHCAVARDLIEQEMENDTVRPVPKMTRSLLFFVHEKLTKMATGGTRSAPKKFVPMFDDYMLSTHIKNNKHGLNQTQNQTGSFFTMFLAACSVGVFEVGAQIIIFMAGDIDIGKSTLMRMLKDCLPRHVVVDMTISSEAAPRRTIWARIEFIDEFGEKQKRQEQSKRTESSNGFISEVKKEYNPITCKWDVVETMNLKGIAAIYGSNYHPGAAMESRSCMLKSQKDDPGAKLEGIAKKPSNKNKFEASVGPKHPERRSAMCQANMWVITSVIRMQVAEAVGVCDIDHTMMSIVVAVARKLLGREFTLGSRLIEHAHKFARAMTEWWLTQMWTTYIVKTQYTRVQTAVIDGQNVQTTVVSPKRDTDELMFYALNSTVNAITCVRVLLMLHRSSNDQLFIDELNRAFRALVRYEDGLSTWVTDPKQPDMVVLDIAKGRDVRDEVKILCGHCKGMGGPDGMLYGFYTNLELERFNGRLVLGTTEIKNKQFRTIRAEYLLQDSIRTAHEIKIWSALHEIAAAFPAMVRLSMCEEYIVFSSAVLAMIRAPQSAHASFKKDGRQWYPEAFAGEQNPVVPGTSDLGRTLWVMAQRYTFDIDEDQQTAKIVKPSGVPTMLPSWVPVIPDGNAYLYLCDGEEGCHKMATTFVRALRVDFQQFNDIATELNLAKTPVEGNGLSEGVKLLVHHAVSMDEENLHLPRQVVVGTTNVCTKQPWVSVETPAVHPEPVTCVNPNNFTDHKRKRTTPSASQNKRQKADGGGLLQPDGDELESSDDDDAFSDDDPFAYECDSITNDGYQKVEEKSHFHVDSTTSIPDAVMPPEDEFFTTRPGILREIRDAHAFKMTGGAVPAHLDAINMNHLSDVYPLQWVDENGHSTTCTLHVIQRCTIHVSISTLFGVSPDSVYVVLEDDTRVTIDIHDTADQIAPGSHIEALFPSAD